MGRPKLGRTCTVEGCGEKHIARGYCKTHYNRARATLEILPKDPRSKRYHPLYIMWHDRKQFGSLCPEWRDDFWAFAEAVGERPTPTHLLRPKRYGEPYSPENWEWLPALKRQPGESRKAFAARKWQNKKERVGPNWESQRALKRKYGITPEDYAQMLEDQGGACAICHRVETAVDRKSHAVKQLSVDHCHRTFKVRALLCGRCNTMLGKVGDSTALLGDMIAYLQKHA